MKVTVACIHLQKTHVGATVVLTFPYFILHVLSTRYILYCL